MSRKGTSAGEERQLRPGPCRTSAERQKWLYERRPRDSLVFFVFVARGRGEKGGTRRTSPPSLRIPRSRIARAGVGALPSKGDLEVLGRDLGEELLLPVSARDGNLLDGDFIEPGLDEGPDGREEVGGVDLRHMSGSGREEEDAEGRGRMSG
jgi:hypothetical protein